MLDRTDQSDQSNETDRAPRSVAAVRLEMRRIGKRFGGVKALSEVSFDARVGEVHAICGENGAGKSTLMKILAGAIVDYEGELCVAGKPVHFVGPRDAERHGISIIHQELNLVPDLSAAANIFLGREKTRAGVFLDNRAMEGEAAESFKMLGANFSPKAMVRDLRIGDQQLVEIAKALSLRSEVIIMDEPTSALAEAEVSNLFRVIRELKGRGVTVIYISHKMDEVFALADRITVLRDGGHVLTVDRSATSSQAIIQSMVGREIANLHIESTSRAAVTKPLLLVRGLRLANPQRPGSLLLDDVGFELHAGEVLGVAGLLGAGRTELLETLFGVCASRPTGVVELAGVRVDIRSPRQAMRAGLALVTEDRKTLGLFDQMNVGKNISICSLADFSRLGWLLPGRERSAAENSVKRLRIKTDGLMAPVLSLSGGNQQKCVIARWLLTNPKVLLLDEPTRGVDVGAKAEIYRLMRELCGNGIGVLMTSSELPELLTVCDRIMVLCEGRVTATFNRGDATENKLVEAAMRFRSKSAAAKSA